MAKRKRRNFTPEFQAEVVLEARTGESSQAALCRRHNLSDDPLSKWKRQLLENAATLFRPAGKQSDADSVAVKHACQTTKSIDGGRPWGNRLETLEISRCDQVWVGDRTYVHLKGRFIYVALLMDVFTRIIRGWHISQHLTQSLTLKPYEAALRQSSQRDIILIKASSLFQMRPSPCGRSMALRYRSLGAGVLGRTDMLKDLSEHSRKKKCISTTMRTSTKRETTLNSLSHRCPTKNDRIRR